MHPIVLPAKVACVMVLSCQGCQTLSQTTLRVSKRHVWHICGVIKKQDYMTKVAWGIAFFEYKRKTQPRKMRKGSVQKAHNQETEKGQR